MTTDRQQTNLTDGAGGPEATGTPDGNAAGREREAEAPGSPPKRGPGVVMRSPENISTTEKTPPGETPHPEAPGGPGRGHGAGSRATRFGSGNRAARRRAERTVETGRVRSREDVLEVLREILADPEQSGAYRTAAARVLMLPEAETTAGCQHCGHCRGTGALSADTHGWIDGQAADQMRAVQAAGGCPKCEGACCGKRPDYEKLPTWMRPRGEATPHVEGAGCAPETPTAPAWGPIPIPDTPEVAAQKKAARESMERDRDGDGDGKDRHE